MRPYETDSPPAVARLLALTMLADGVLDQAESEAIERSAFARSLTVDSATFERVIQEFCEDMVMSTTYRNGAHMQLDRDVLESLFDEVSDPLLQRRLLATMVHIVRADGVTAPAEQALLSVARAKWGLEVPPRRLL